MLLVQVGFEMKSGVQLLINFVGCLMLNVEIAMRQLNRPFRQNLLWGPTLVYVQVACDARFQLVVSATNSKTS